MSRVRLISYGSLAIALIAIVGALSRSSLSYSATCCTCLQEAGGVENSIFGVTYFRSEKERRSQRGAFTSYTGGTNIAPVDPGLYPVISGHACKHHFTRQGFCRHSFHATGCGRFGGQQHAFRMDLMENLYRAYERVPDQALARETLELIDRLYPLVPAKGAADPSSYPPIHHTFQIGSLPNEPLSILYRGLALVSHPAEWREVLDAARSGNGSLELLVDPTALARYLKDPDPVRRVQVIDQLADLKDPEAWSWVAECLKDPETREFAARKIAYSGQQQHFRAVFEAEEKADARRIAEDGNSTRYTPGVFDPLLVKFTPEEIRNLFAQDDPYLDRIGFAAIRRQNRFEFIGEVLDLLNKRPSSAAVATLESLFQGPTPFEAGRTYSDLPRQDPWTRLIAKTPMGPVDSYSNYTAQGKQSIHHRQQIVRLGLLRDPARWTELRDLYLAGLSQLGGEQTSAAAAQAMALSDQSRTLDFLFSQMDLDYHRKEQTVAAIAGIGAIADPGSLAPLSEFLSKGAGTHFEGHSYYQPFVSYALHRCRGSQRWRVVQGPDSVYLIEK